ncbi:tyrosine-type recombinase/integrase, partial [Chitinimonas sp. PSY-7]|uniref:tyrosine-type recombinase/integrase n=1 Tax=Chitinimonas sp. PSY-7 TaxID=3459088 RepID=UPI00403FED0C
MPIYKHSSSTNWYVDIISPSGKRIRRSTGTTDESQAQEYHDRLKSDLWRAERLGERIRRTFKEAALLWLKEMGHKRSIRNDKIFLRHYLGQFGGKYLDEITREDIIDAVSLVDATNATKNRYLCLLRALFRKAKGEWDWIEKVPFIKTLPERKRRIRWLTVEEVQRLLAELPTHQNQFVRFALATGLRQANVLGMTWDRVDLIRRTCWVEADDFKTGQAHGVPLNEGLSVISCSRHIMLPRRMYASQTESQAGGIAGNSRRAPSSVR